MKIISDTELDQIKKSAYFLNNKKLMKHIIKSINQIKNGDYIVL